MTSAAVTALGYNSRLEIWAFLYLESVLLCFLTCEFPTEWSSRKMCLLEPSDFKVYPGCQH